ncbi:MAG: holin [Ruminococcaceae bacterium]|nr:holin [Oscillospiraceae bacterium]
MDITNVLTAAIALLAAIVTTFVIPWLRARIGSERLGRLMGWAAILVDAAEQIYVGPGRGAEKKAYVLSLLRQRGIEVDEQALDAVIEAAVRRLA